MTNNSSAPNQTAAALAVAIDELAHTFGGRVILPSDDLYDDARRVWNGRADKRPALIVRPTDSRDVAVAVRFARERGLPVSIKGGGHGLTGSAMANDGIAIDMALMKQIMIDPNELVARVGGGVRWGEFLTQAADYGLAVPSGVLPSVGVAGLTLGGGIGWLVRKYGLTIDNLLSVEVVTASGDTIRASEEDHPELFWAVRGGGSNFGVATEFEFRLHPVSTVVAGLVAYPREQASEVLRFFRDYTATAPDEVSALAAVATLPEIGPVVAIGACYVGDIEEKPDALRALQEFGTPIAGQIGPMPYSVLLHMFEQAGEMGLGHHTRSDFMQELSDEAIDTIVEQANRATSPLTQVQIVHLGGAMAGVPSEATAFAHRDANYMLAILATWPNPAESEPHVAWADGMRDAMKPFVSGGVYVNYLGKEGEERVKAAYGSNHDRLAEIKAEYDPDNLFRVNQNIKPKTAPGG